MAGEVKWAADGTRVFMRDGGFDLRGCPDPVRRAALIVRAVNSLASHEARIAELEEALRGLLKANDDVKTVLCDGPEVPGFDPTALGIAQRRVTEAEQIARAVLHTEGK